MRIAHVIHAIAPESGGPSVTVPALCDELGALGHDVRLHVTNFGGPPDQSHVRGYALHSHAHMPCGGKLGVSPSLHAALIDEAQHADIVHSHGLWLATNLDAYWTTRNKTCRVVLSPRGMLQPVALSRKGVAKHVLWATWQRAALEAAHCLHVTSESELQSVRASGLRNPVVIIPNGVAIPSLPAGRETDRRRLLFVGRIDPIKGIDLLLNAWSQVAPAFPNWDLWLVGPSSNGYGEQMRKLAETLRAPRVTFAGPAFGTQRDAHLSVADLFVLPSRSENFGMAVAEALAAGVPVVCSKGAPWPGLVNERCGYWVDVGAEPLAAVLHEALALSPSTRAEMGALGRAWMQREFGWRAQASKMSQTYRWLSGNAPAPSFLNVIPPSLNTNSGYSNGRAHSL